LRPSDHKKPFYIHCDASDVGGAASLEQLDEDGRPYAVQFWSKKFSETERNNEERDIHRQRGIETLQTSHTWSRSAFIH
jgi:hypothetical protein